MVEIYGPWVEIWWLIGALEMYLLPHMWRNKSLFKKLENKWVSFFLINQYVLLLEKDCGIITALLCLNVWKMGFLSLLIIHVQCMYGCIKAERRCLVCLIATASYLFIMYIHTIGRVGLDNYTSCTPTRIDIHWLP